MLDATATKQVVSATNSDLAMSVPFLQGREEILGGGVSVATVVKVHSLASLPDSLVLAGKCLHLHEVHVCKK
jgi:hypothetical protein